MAESHMVRQNTLGSSGVEVGEISLGSWHTWERMEFGDAVELFTTAVSNGVNTFDVGNYNSGLHDEGLDAHGVLGKVMKASGVPREDFRVELKAWLWEQGSRSLSEAFEDDLDAMGLEQADIAAAGHYYEGKPEYFQGELDDKIRELANLVVTGRAKTWGMCNWGPEHVQRALTLCAHEHLPAPEIVQLKYSIARRSIVEGEPFKALFDSSGITLQPSDVLEGGFLVGKRNSDRRVGFDAGGIFDRVVAAAPHIADAARSLGLSPAQAAIAFCLSNEATSTVLVGASSIRQLGDNVKASATTLAERAEVREALREFWLDRDAVRATDAP